LSKESPIRVAAGQFTTITSGAPRELALTDITVGHGVLSHANELLEEYRAVRLVLLADDRVAPLYAAPLQKLLRTNGYDAELLTIAGGEETKTFETLGELYGACQSLGVERRDLVVAVGGGMVGDVAGMLAGTYLRGLNFVQAPTSLVAIITASIGGKVGVNYRGYKNLIGLFAAPAMVLADLDTLQTLAPIEFKSGLGELLTVGVLGEPEIFHSLEAKGVSELDSLIVSAIKCKARIVEADPFDRLGIRAKLNLGHTFGHAIETLSGFTVPHGIAVGVGLHIAARLACALNLFPEELAERVRQALIALNLPTSFTGFQPEDVLGAMRKDKKREGGRLRWVLPTSIGEAALISEDQVPPGLVRGLLKDLLLEGTY
jgi:3-dehydroquinate synthase